MEQPSLFPESPQTQTVDGAQIADHIAAHARPIEYADRTSEAARDQGWGSVVPPATPTASTSLKPYDIQKSSPDKGLPSRAQVRKGMSVSEIADQDRINTAGTSAARLALGQTTKIS